MLNSFAIFIRFSIFASESRREIRLIETFFWDEESTKFILNQKQCINNSVSYVRRRVGRVDVHKYSKRYEQTRQKSIPSHRPPSKDALFSFRKYTVFMYNSQKGGYDMSKWLTLQQLSEKRGINETTLRYWKSSGYIKSSTIDNVVMLDDESVSHFLDAHQTKELDEDCLKKIIQEKELEREIMLAHLEDELFLMKTQKLYQPLFHILIEELSALIIDNCQREIFLAISTGEPIARVAARHQMTYAQAAETYNVILDKLGENTQRIATLRQRTMELLFS